MSDCIKQFGSTHSKKDKLISSPIFRHFWTFQAFGILFFAHFNYLNYSKFRLRCEDQIQNNIHSVPFYNLINECETHDYTHLC